MTNVLYAHTAKSTHTAWAYRPIYGYPLVTMERTRQVQTLIQMPAEPALVASSVFFHEEITPEYQEW